MNFRLLSLATLLVLGVTSVCAGNQPPQYSAKVKHGTLFYYHNAPNGPGKWIDRFCFQPDAVKWYKTEWRLVFQNYGNSGARNAFRSQGNSCFDAGSSDDVYKYITNNGGFNDVLFQLGKQRPENILKWTPVK
ncbi:hypothetical protein ACQY0O_003235 [Thecaphora frezii]